tara:strand:+ start:4376 stop:4816 length:441 start_codon:yes stop_codon:yes gene_type:complete
MIRVILCDIDGTIANVLHRINYVKGKEKNWEEFNSRANNDSVKEDIANILREFYRDDETEIHIVTGREDKWKQDTEEWLRVNDIPFHGLYMRGLGDSRSDADVKRDIYNTHFADKKVWFVLEDRDKVVKMWRDLGLSCMQVAEGEY